VFHVWANSQEFHFALKHFLGRKTVLRYLGPN